MKSWIKTAIVTCCALGVLVAGSFMATESEASPSVAGGNAPHSGDPTLS